MVKDKVGVDIEDQLLFCCRVEDGGGTHNGQIGGLGKEYGHTCKQPGTTRRKEPEQKRILPYTSKGTIVVGSQWKGRRKKTE